MERCYVAEEGDECMGLGNRRDKTERKMHRHSNAISACQSSEREKEREEIILVGKEREIEIAMSEVSVCA